MKKIISFLSIIAILAGIFLTVEAIKQSTLSTSQEKANFKKTYLVTRRNISEKTSLAGTIQSIKAQEVNLSFNTSGIIQDILVREGDYVASNSVVAILASLDASSSQRQEAEKALKLAQAKLAQALARPTTKQIKYWDQSVVDAAKKYFTAVQNENKAKLSAAQNQVRLYQVKLNNITRQIQDLQAKLASQNDSLVAETKADLIKTYVVLDKNIWLHNNIQEKYFQTNDQASIRVREKEAEAFKEYYTVKWYMESFILDHPQKWAISECLIHMQDALQKLSLSYATTLDAFKEPYYKARLTGEDQESINDAREEVAASLGQILNSQSHWKNGSIKDNKLMTDLDSEKNNAKTLLQDAKNHLKAVRKQAQNAINQASAHLKQSYQNALKTKTIIIPQDLSLFQAAVQQAQIKYNNLLNQERKISELKTPSQGIITAILAPKGSLVQAGEPIIKIRKNTDLMIIKADIPQSALDKVKIFRLVTIRSSLYPAKTWQGKIEEISPQESTGNPTSYSLRVSFDQCALEEKDSGCTSQLQAQTAVKLEIITAEKRNALAVPSDYLINKDGKNFVLTKRFGSMALQQVRIGIRGENFVEILQGLTQGDEVFLPND